VERRIAVARALERALLACGAVLISFWLGAQLHRHVLHDLGRASFPGEAVPREIGPAPSEPLARPVLDPALFDPEVDTTRWSATRLAAYLDSLWGGADSRVALLRIPSLDLEVVVLDGTDEWSLNRGVGWIEGTALPGAEGNLGIAGHRDGFFRALEGLKGGERIELRLPDGRTSHYSVSWIEIVRPEDVWVLEPTPEPALTLVTSHPFYFIGSAPDRYVVRAAAAPGAPQQHARADALGRM
jgi:sortase A